MTNDAPDIKERLRDLHKQATVERSHFYVGKCIEDALSHIEALEKAAKAEEVFTASRLKLIAVQEQRIKDLEAEVEWRYNRAEHICNCHAPGLQTTTGCPVHGVRR